MCVAGLNTGNVEATGAGDGGGARRLTSRGLRRAGRRAEAARRVQRQAGGDAGEAVAAHRRAPREGALQPLGEQAQAGRAAGEVERVDGVGRRPAWADGRRARRRRCARGRRRARARASASSSVGAPGRARRGRGRSSARRRRRPRSWPLSARPSSSWPRRSLDHRHQPPMLRRVGVEGAHAAQLGDALRVVDGVDQVPGREVEVDRARHLARRRAVAARRRSAP